jgi:hypothetical protein
VHQLLAANMVSNSNAVYHGTSKIQWHVIKITIDIEAEKIWLRGSISYFDLLIDREAHA